MEFDEVYEPIDHVMAEFDALFSSQIVCKLNGLKTLKVIDLTGADWDSDDFDSDSSSSAGTTGGESVSNLLDVADPCDTSPSLIISDLTRPDAHSVIDLTGDDPDNEDSRADTNSTEDCQALRMAPSLSGTIVRPNYYGTEPNLQARTRFFSLLFYAQS
ncbi:hypothetical protein DL769_008765 [Monosporascus sp. CRB-8-3]|nr:hypothetical protein DL769_008765 [Monosporascus sp. CRB-8-3]